MEEQSLDFKVARDFFIEMKYCTIQNYLKKNVGMLDFVILDIDQLHGQINKGQVDNFVKCLELVLVYIFFCKNQAQAAIKKGS